MDTSEKLDKLSSIRAEIDKIRQQKQYLIDTIITPPIQHQLQEIEEEFSTQLADARAEEELLSLEIQADVLDQGKTVRGSWIMAVWNKGRAGGWDSKGLDGYALAHPEILILKKPDGDPTVTFRDIK